VIILQLQHHIYCSNFYTETTFYTYCMCHVILLNTK